MMPLPEGIWLFIALPAAELSEQPTPLGAVALTRLGVAVAGGGLEITLVEAPFD